MDKAIIAIDGFAATGKSTLAKRLSKHLGLPYVDSGALFRGITFLALEKGWITHNNIYEKSIKEGINELKINFDSLSNAVTLNKRNITNQIRSKLVSSYVSQIAKLPFVRDYLLKQQRKMGSSHGLVMDGRDIGTAVFPEADFKFFFTAKPEVRAQRRLEEMEANGYFLGFNEVLKNILDRDKIDTERKVSPLIKADDAIEIDSTYLSLQQVFEICIAKIKGK